MMEKIVNKIRYVAYRILGLPNPSLVMYMSDFPDGKLIGKPKEIGKFSIINYGGDVKIGNNVKIGYGVIILSASTITGSKNTEIIRKMVIIGDNVEIGSNTVVLPGVTIGDNSTIGAGAVVIDDIPTNSVAVGVPAKVIKKKTW